MKRILPVIAGISCGLSLAHCQDIKKPNILIILADDMGYSDAGCYGGEIQTPVLDRLAARGLRYTNFYNAGRSWPSRANLMTGYYAQAVRRDGDVASAGTRGIRPSWAKLLPEYLKQAGYHSYHSGKWHIDGLPNENGFENSYVYMNTEGYFGATTHTEDGAKLPPVIPDGTSYSTTRIADYAIKYLRQHEAKYPGQPFFQYLSFHSPHFPIQAFPEDISIYKDRYKNGWDELRKERLQRMIELGFPGCSLPEMDPVTIPSWNVPEAELRKRIGEGEAGYAVPWHTLTVRQKEFQSDKMAVHAAMVHRMDIEIGRVIDKIEEMGALENTLIIFASDNGASAEQMIREGGHAFGSVTGSPQSYLGIGPGWAGASNTPFRLYKCWNHEGGICTPFIVCWPSGIRDRGEFRSNPGHLVDILPTIAEIVSLKIPETPESEKIPALHGISLVPTFDRDNTVKHKYLWWSHDGNRAIRIGNWKLVSDHKKGWELFNLKNDRSESVNLAVRYPGKVRKMELEWIRRDSEFKALSE